MPCRFAVPAAACLTLAAAGPVMAQPAAPVGPPESAASTSPVPVPAEPDPGDGFGPLPGPAVAWPAIDSVTETDTEVTTAEAGDLRYTLEVTGMSGFGITAAFRQNSALYRGRGDPANLAQIRRRAADDTVLIDELLRSTGRYGGDVDVEIVPPTAAGGSVAVTLKVTPGPVYTFAKVDLVTPDPADAALVAALFGIAPGSPVEAAVVNGAEAALAGRLADKGFAFPNIGTMDIVVDHETQTATLVQKVDPGPAGVFGSIRGEGKAVLPDSQLARLARFKTGQTYDGDELADIRRALVATGLYSVVSVRPERAGTTADGKAIVDLVVTGDTAPLRTVSASVGYSTDQGFQVAGSWQHRNLFPPQGAFTVNGTVGQRQQSFGVELRRSNWGRRDRTLLLGASLTNEEQDAYNATTLTVGASVTRETNVIWQKPWYWSLGAQVLVSNETDLSDIDPVTGNAVRTLYYILSVPGSVTLDRSDDLLDPTRGWRATARLDPQISFQSGSFAYAIAQIEGTAYLPAGARTTLAGRLHFGTIAGASRGDVPPTQRFYAGGGGSVRGFSYQAVGPRNAAGVPTGGNSISEGSFEARIRLRGNLGVVPFIDVGQVYSGTVPGFGSLAVGAGLGLRYYTSFGPVRVDVATPVNPQPGDPRVQFYVSIGQAF